MINIPSKPLHKDIKYPLSFSGLYSYFKFLDFEIFKNKKGHPYLHILSHFGDIIYSIYLGFFLIITTLLKAIIIIPAYSLLIIKSFFIYFIFIFTQIIYVLAIMLLYLPIYLHFILKVIKNFILIILITSLFTMVFLPTYLNELFIFYYAVIFTLLQISQIIYTFITCILNPFIVGIEVILYFIMIYLFSFYLLIIYIFDFLIISIPIFFSYLLITISQHFTIIYTIIRPLISISLWDWITSFMCIIFFIEYWHNLEHEMHDFDIESEHYFMYMGHKIRVKRSPPPPCACWVYREVSHYSISFIFIFYLLLFHTISVPLNKFWNTITDILILKFNYYSDSIFLEPVFLLSSINFYPFYIWFLQILIVLLKYLFIFILIIGIPYISYLILQSLEKTKWERHLRIFYYRDWLIFHPRFHRTSKRPNIFVYLYEHYLEIKDYKEDREWENYTKREVEKYEAYLKLDKELKERYPTDYESYKKHLARQEEIKQRREERLRQLEEERMRELEEDQNRLDETIDKEVERDQIREGEEEINREPHEMPKK